MQQFLAQLAPSLRSTCTGQGVQCRHNDGHWTEEMEVNLTPVTVNCQTISTPKGVYDEPPNPNHPSGPSYRVRPPPGTAPTHRLERSIRHYFPPAVGRLLAAGIVEWHTGRRKNTLALHQGRAGTAGSFTESVSLQPEKWKERGDSSASALFVCAGNVLRSVHPSARRSISSRIS